MVAAPKDIESHWKYAGKAGDTKAFQYTVKVTFDLTDEAKAARDRALMDYLRKFGELYKGPYSIDPVALSNLWAEAWMVGHGEGSRKARLEHANVKVEKPKRKAK